MMTHDRFTAVHSFVSGYRTNRLRFYRYRHEADVLPKVGLAVALAALTGLAAQIRVPLPFTPVPITMQTFAVLLTGIVLGLEYGGLSQAIYVGVGVSGVPWFQGGGAGMGHLLGPTGGYLIGFVVAAAAIGYLIDRYPGVRRLSALAVVLCIINFGVIYAIGLPWLFGWLSLVEGTSITVSQLLTMGLFPFVPGDIVKLLAAALLGTAITPKTTHRDELATTP